MNALSEIINFIKKETLVPVVVCAVEDNDSLSIWRGISIKEGVVHVDLSKAHPGDLLHEVGHLITTPLELRRLVSGDLGECEEFLHSLYDIKQDADDLTPLYYSDDDAATFWAFAVCRHLGLSDTLPFENGYESPDVPWQEYHLTCLLGVGNPLGSRFSGKLYYLGMLKSKADDVPVVWDICCLTETLKEI